MNDINKQKNLEKQQIILNSAYVFDGVARSIQDTIEHIKKAHTEHSIHEWRDLYLQFLDKLKIEKIGYTSLPEEELKKFYTSAKINFFFEEMISRMRNTLDENSIFYQLQNNYNNCTKPEFLAAKQAIYNNLHHFSDTHKTKNVLDTQYNEALRVVFFSIKEIQDYFSSFIFDMKNKHSGKYELMHSKNVNFQTKYNPQSLDDGVIFRFIDCVTIALSRIIIKDGEITNKDEIVSYILLPKIVHGCHLCRDSNEISFNHKEGLLQEINSEVCLSFLKKRNTNFLKTKIATKGKIIFIDDVKNIAHKNLAFINEIESFGSKNGISTYLNTWEGQNGFMNIAVQLFNVAYIQSGSHSSHVKATTNGLNLTFLNKENNSLGEISVSYSASLVDYDSAIKIAGSEKALLKFLKSSKHTIIDIKPGTYAVVHHIKKIEDNTYLKKDLAFCKITWKNDDTELKPFTKKQWEDFQ